MSGTTESVQVQIPGADHVIDAIVDGEIAAFGASAIGLPRLEAPAASVEIRVDAPVDASDGSFIVRGRSCATPIATGDQACPAEDTRDFVIDVDVTIEQPSAQPVDGFAEPAPDRWQPETDGSAVLPGEVVIIGSTSSSADRVGALVDGLGGRFTGADAQLGVYQARFADTGVALVGLRASAEVSQADVLVGFPPETLAVPGDWAPLDDRHKWSFVQVGAPQAWNRTVGSTGVDMGIVDTGIYPRLPDLPLASYEAPFWSASSDWQNYQEGTGVDAHGTHAASTMCAADGDGGVVGVAQQCRLHALDLTDARYLSWSGALFRTRDWIRRHPEIRVVNISMQFMGASRSTGPSGPTCVSTGRNLPSDFIVDVYRRAFLEMGNILWVVAGGNCSVEGHRDTIEDRVPAALANLLPNVVAVSATARSDTEASAMASYSAVDGTMAAPGGTAEEPIWSSVFLCADRSSCWSSTDGMVGTSSAAPIVAGAAGLMYAENPSLSPVSAKHCLADSPARVTDSNMRELWVPDAIACAAGEATLCARESDSMSREGVGQATIDFVNTTDEPVLTWWLDYTGNRVYYQQVEPGGSYRQDTWITHPWVITDVDGNCLGWVEADVASQRYFV